MSRAEAYTAGVGFKDITSGATLPELETKPPSHLPDGKS